MITRTFSWHWGLPIVSLLFVGCGGSTEKVPLGNGNQVNGDSSTGSTGAVSSSGNSATSGGTASGSGGSASGTAGTASGTAGTASGTGGTASGTGGTGATSGGSPGPNCVPADCAGQPVETIAKLCPDGTAVGLTACARLPDGTCGWAFPPCPGAVDAGPPTPMDAGLSCCPADWNMTTCVYPDGTQGQQCHNPQMGCLTSNFCGQGCDKIVSGRCDSGTTGGGSTGTAGTTGAATGGTACPAGQIWCPGCTPGTGTCSQGGCPGFACIQADAGAPLDASPPPCSQVTNLNECELRNDCHSVFTDPQTCDCAALGCCERFSGCAAGAKASCSPGTGVMCAIAGPHCEGDYVISYANGCFEGCVQSKECAP